MLHKIPSTSAGFALLTAGAHTAVTIMSSAFHWSGTSSCGQQDKLWLSGRNPQERTVFYEAQLLGISWRSPLVTNTAKLPKSPISNFYYWSDFLSVFLSLSSSVCAHLGTQMQGAPEQVWRSGRGRSAPAGAVPKTPRISEWQKHSAASQDTVCPHPTAHNEDWRQTY